MNIILKSIALILVLTSIASCNKEDFTSNSYIFKSFTSTSCSDPKDNGDVQFNTNNCVIDPEGETVCRLGELIIDDQNNITSNIRIIYKSDNKIALSLTGTSKLVDNCFTINHFRFTKSNSQFVHSFVHSDNCLVRIILDKK